MDEDTAYWLGMFGAFIAIIVVFGLIALAEINKCGHLGGC